MPAYGLFTLCILAYTIVMLLFAGVYIAVDHPGVHCGIAPKGEWPSMYHAFIFSLETLTTIGYGIPTGGDFFDETCVLVAVAVYFEAMIFIILNASIVGVLFARVSVANRRASQIIFSNKGTIRCVRNRFFFMFQVGEASFFHYHPIVEAHVRVYGVLHEEAITKSGRGASEDDSGDGIGGDGSVERALFLTRVMRLTNPNDELGGMLFLATPQVISHRIDLWSPMFPPAARMTRTDDLHDGSAYHFPGLVFREADREVAISDEAGETSASRVDVGRSSRVLAPSLRWPRAREPGLDASASSEVVSRENSFADCSREPSIASEPSLGYSMANSPSESERHTLLDSAADAAGCHLPRHPRTSCSDHKPSGAVLHPGSAQRAQCFEVQGHEVLKSVHSNSPPPADESILYPAQRDRRRRDSTDSDGTRTSAMEIDDEASTFAGHSPGEASRGEGNRGEESIPEECGPRMSRLEHPALSEDSGRRMSRLEHPALSALSVGFTPSGFTPSSSQEPAVNRAGRVPGSGSTTDGVRTSCPCGRQSSYSPPFESSCHERTPRVRPLTGNDASAAQLREMRRQIKLHLKNSQLEVVVFVEGIDPHSSNTFQARHSYTADDIVFDQSFEPCMSLEDDGMAKLDWDRFHELRDTPFNASHIIGGSHS